MVTKYGKGSKVLSFFLIVCIMLSVFTTSVFAKNEPANTVNKKGMSPNVQIVSQEITETENKFKLKIEVPTQPKEKNEKSSSSDSTENSTAISAVSVYYIDVSIYGSNGSVWGKMYVTGSIPTHNLTLALWNGTYGAYGTKANSVTTTSIGSSLNPTKVSAVPIETKFWDATRTGTIDGASISYDTYDFIFNKKAVECPKYTDPLSGKTMTEPETTWTKVLNPLPGLTTSQRNTYKAWYEQTYNNGTVLDWSNVQVHHIKPRAYGGTHSYDNLIPLNTPFHITVTSWWASY
jgi:hypothetical protein